MNVNEDRPILSVAKIIAGTVVSGSVRLCRYLQEVLWGVDVRRQWQTVCIF